jgi:predicted nucleotidyltransferase
MESTDKNIIQHIYLFGSYAYGRPNKESDLDIAVVLDNIENSHEVYGNIALKLFHENIMPLDLLVYTEKEFYHGKNPESIENTIMEKGEILYVREKNSN